MKLTIFFIASTCIIWAQAPAAAPAAASSAVPDDRTVISVGGFEINKKNFESVLASMPPEQQSPQAKGSLMDNLTGILQVAAEARAAQFDKDPARAFQLKLRAEQDLATAFLVEQINKMGDDAFLKEWYSRNQSQFSQWKARHVLIRMQGSVVPVRKGMKDLTDAEALAKAKAVRAKLVAPGADFGAIVKLDSDDAGSSGNGGDLGFFGAGDMVPPVEEAVAKLKVNDISEPVKTEFGYHVVQLLEVRAKPFEEAKQDIVTKSRGELQTKVLDAIRKKHPATVNPEYFGK